MGRFYVVAGADLGFLKGGCSQTDMTDVQSQKSAEELPIMHASANWKVGKAQLDY